MQAAVPPPTTCPSVLPDINTHPPSPPGRRLSGCLPRPQCPAHAVSLPPRTKSVRPPATPRPGHPPNCPRTLPALDRRRLPPALHHTLEQPCQPQPLHLYCRAPSAVQPGPPPQRPLLPRLLDRRHRVPPTQGTKHCPAPPCGRRAPPVMQRLSQSPPVMKRRRPVPRRCSYLPRGRPPQPPLEPPAAGQSTAPLLAPGDTRAPDQEPAAEEEGAAPRSGVFSRNAPALACRRPALPCSERKDKAILPQHGTGKLRPLLHRLPPLHPGAPPPDRRRRTMHVPRHGARRRCRRDS